MLVLVDKKRLDQWLVLLRAEEAEWPTCWKFQLGIEGDGIGHESVRRSARSRR